jgi:hypothetical protein
MHGCPASPELDQQLRRILSPRSIGSMGSTIHLAECPPVVVDWLRLGKPNRFAVFTHCASPATDCALFLSRLNRREDQAYLDWFTQEVLPGIYGGRTAWDAIAQAGASPATLMIIVGPKLLSRGRTPLDTVERQFGVQYLRGICSGSMTVDAK